MLTPEEEKELAMLEAEESQEAGQISALSPEEEAELAELEAQETMEQKVSGIESTLRGAAQGVTAGFADEIAGAVESAFTDKTYEQARDEHRASFELARQENPVAFTSGEVAGGIAQGLVAGPSIKAAAGLGALAGLGNSEEDEIERQLGDAFIGGSVGAVAGKVGEKVGAGLGKLGRGASKFLEEEADAFGLRAIGVWTKAARKKLAKKLAAKGQKTEEFLQNFEAEVDVNGKPLLTLNKTQEELLQDVADRKAQLWDQDMGGILKEVDLIAEKTGKKAVNPTEFAAHLEQEIVEPLVNSANFDERMLGEKLLKRTSAYKEIKGDWSLMDLHAEKVKISQKVNFLKMENNDLELNSGLRSMLKKTNEFIKDKVAAISPDGETIARYTDANKRYATLSDSMDFIEDSVQAQKEGLSGSIRKALGMAASTSGALVTGGVVGGVPGAALGGALVVASKSPKVNLAMSKTLRKVGQGLTNNPVNEEYLTILAQAASRGTEAFNAALRTVEAKMDGFITGGPEEQEQHRQSVRGANLSPRAQMRANEQINNMRIPDMQEVKQPMFKQKQFRRRDSNGRKI